jgi:pimeloyl-ACP methyl ester carboxylesterase
VSLLVPLLVAWLVWAALIFLAQRRMIFPGRSAAPLAEGESLPGARLHRIELPDARVEAWWLPPAEGAARPAPAVIFAHGNMELVDEWVGSFEPLRRAGGGVLLVEYPGYGRSTGVATERSVTAAMVAAYDLLAGMPGEIDPARIVAFGRSVGGGPAAALARERPLAALVLNSSFTGVGAYARRYFVPPLFVRHRFDNEGAVRAFRGPVLVQHGVRDRTVPLLHGQRLAAAASDGRLMRYDCGHNDCPWGRMLGDAVAFLRERGILPAG